MDFCKGTVGSVSSSQRRNHDVFHWKIDGFSKLSEKVNRYYGSPFFHFRGHECQLLFYPNGHNNCPSGKFLKIYFSSRPHGASSSVHLTFGLKTRRGVIEKRFSRCIIYPDECGLRSGGTLIRRTEFLGRKTELAPSDRLTFVLFLGPPEIIRGDEKVAEDLAKLLTSGDRSDATIVVGEAEFRVHSCILAARAPAFAALLEHGTGDKANQRVTVTDCRPDIFREFLEHIYTGGVRDLSAEDALCLYPVADRYRVEDLREACGQCIGNNLCSKTLCEALQLALKYGDEDLLQSASYYFATNVNDVVRSAEWHKYTDENPREVNEILKRSFGRS